MSPRPSRELASVCSLLLFVSCSSGGSPAGASAPLPSGDAPAVGGLGTPIAKGLAADLRVTKDGKFASFLTDAEKPHLEGVPPQMLHGELMVVPTSGGQARRVGSGVTNWPGGCGFTADSQWVLFLAGYNPASQEGQLYSAKLSGGAPTLLGKAVTFFSASPDSRWVAFIDSGALKVAELGGEHSVNVAGDIANAQFSPDGAFLLYQRRLVAAGGLFAAAAGKWDHPVKLGEQVGEYRISPDSRYVGFTSRSDAAHGTWDLFVAGAPAFKAKRLAFGCGNFQFSADSKQLARTEGQRSDSYKNVKVGALFVSSPEGENPVRVGDRVLDFELAPDSKAIAYLDQYDSAAGFGTMTLATLPEGKAKKLGVRVPNFQWDPDSKHVAFLERFLKPVYSVDLMFFTLGEDEPVKVKQGVFGYGFSPKGEYLLLRSNCIREGRACDLFSEDPRAPKTEPKMLVQQIYSFRFSDDARRLLLTYARFDSDRYDVATYDMKTGDRKTLDQGVVLPAHFLDAGGSKAAYLIGDKQRAGVYVATVP